MNRAEMKKQVIDLERRVSDLTRQINDIRNTNNKLVDVLESAGIITQVDRKKVVKIDNSDPWGWGDTMYDIKVVK